MKLSILIEPTNVERENSALLGYHATSSGNFIPMFRDNLSVQSPGFKNPKTPEDDTERLSRNVGNKLPLLAA